MDGFVDRSPGDAPAPPPSPRDAGRGQLVASIRRGRVVDLADVPVLLRASGAARAVAIANMLGALPPHAGPARVSLRHLVRAPGLPRRRPEHSGPQVRVWTDDQRISIEDASGARARLTRDAAWIGGEGLTAEIALRRLALVAVTHLLAPRDRVVLHAGAIARADGAAYLLLGGTGKGKSTMGLAALAAGWRLLADDMVVVRWFGAAPQAQGIPRPPAVPPDVGGAAGGRAVADDPRKRLELSVHRLSAGWFPLAGIIRVGHGSSIGGAIERISAIEVAHTLLSSFTGVISPPVLRPFLTRAAQLSRLPAWHAGHGTDPTTRVLAATALLRRLEAEAEAGGEEAASRSPGRAPAAH